LGAPESIPFSTQFTYSPALPRGLVRGRARPAAAPPVPHTLERGEKIVRSLAQRALAFLKNEDGPTAVEYAIMMALIIVVCILSITILGTNSNNTYSYVGTQVNVKGS
jgi:pilus assembly protein Flp/PilA